MPLNFLRLNSCLPALSLMALMVGGLAAPVQAEPLAAVVMPADRQPPQDPADEVAALRRQAGESRASGNAALERIERERVEADAECHTRLLVNACLEQVREQYVRDLRAARQQVLRAGELERQAKRLELDHADAVAAYEAPQRARQAEVERQRFAADQAVRQARYAAEDARHARDLAAAAQRAELEARRREQSEREAQQRQQTEAVRARQRALQAEEDRRKYDDARQKKAASPPSPN